MSVRHDTSTGRKVERIDVSWDYALCAWARHFNTSERRVREAVAAVGDQADRVRDHLAAAGRGERPCGD